MPDVYSRIDGLANYDYQEFIVSSMIAAGWVDVSSSKSKDGYVLHSTGEDGTLDMYVGIKTHATDPIHTTYIRISMGMKYTPGASGTAGTWSVAMGEGCGVRTVYTQDQMEGETYPLFNRDAPPTYYSVNKDRAIFIRLPNEYQWLTATGFMYGCPGILGIGKPKLYYTPVGGRCMSLWGAGCPNTLANTLVMASTPSSDTNGALQVPIFDTLAGYPRATPDDNVAPLAKVYFGDTNNGLMGEIEMVRTVQCQVSAGEIITDGVYKYKTLWNRGDRNTLAPSITMYAIPVEKIVT